MKIWAGRVLTGLSAAFLLLDGGMKLVKARVSVEGTVQLGYPESAVAPIGAVLILCTLIYLVPRTAALGAILLTGYLGGAVATNLRIGAPLFAQVLFPVYFGVMVWGGLYWRDAKVSTLIPIRSER